MATFAYALRAPRPIVRVELDVVGDGQPSLVDVQGQGLEAFTMLTFRPVVAGTHSVHLAVTDACGRSDRTGAERRLEVRP